MKPTDTDNRLRIRFWDLYDQYCTDEHPAPITAESVCRGVCSAGYFIQTYLSRPEKSAWLMCAPAAYQTYAKEALTFGLDQMRQILAEPMVDAQTGKFNVQLANLKLRIVALLDVRVHGAPVQKTLAINAHLGEREAQAALKEVARATEIRTVDELERKLKELDARERKAQHLDPASHLPVIEVESGG